MKALGSALGLLTLVVFMPAAANSQDKVYRGATDEQLEKILKDLDVTYKKSIDPKDSHAYYDFLKDSFDLRLHNYGGKDLWIDCIFSDKANLDIANKWNVRAKFSRAVLLRGDTRDTISLEAQLNCFAGTTDGIVRTYLQRFFQECKDYNAFNGE